MKTLTSATLTLALVASCANVPINPGHRPANPQPVASTDGWSASTSARREAVLYARDGTPVERNSDGTGSLATGEVDAPPRGIQNEGAASRPYMLELYQSAVQRGDDLSLEVEALDQRLREAEQRELDLQTQIGQLEGLVSQLTEERDRIQSQSFELAARLTTAQIRRLEAEKLLLETVLENGRQQARDAEIQQATGVSPAQDLGGVPDETPRFAERPNAAGDGQ